MSWRLAAVLALLTLSGIVCAASENRLRIGNNAEPESLDPQRASSVSALNIIRDLDEGLVQLDAQGQPQPAAAQGWQRDASGLVYTFTLRPSARWSDGSALQAQDFVAALRRAVDPRSGAPFAQLLSPIAQAEAIMAGRAAPETLGVTALDAQQLRITLARATPQFLALLAHPVSFPLHGPSWQRYGAGFARAGRMLSNGAYQLRDWVVHDRIELVRNPHYWNAAAVRITQVSYYAIDDVDAELKRYLAGELDITAQIPLVQAPQLRRSRGAELRLAPYLGTYYLGLNVRRAPLDDPRLRRALSLAIDRQLIVDKVMNGLAVPATSWVPPGTADYSPQTPDWAQWPRTQQLAEARRLYREAGYTSEHPLYIELRYNQHDDHRRIAIVVAAMWKQWLGVQTQLVGEENKVFLANRRAGRITQVFRASWIADDQDAAGFLQVLASGNGRNDTGFADAAYDALLAQAAAQGQAPSRRASLEEAERYLLAQQPLIPLYFYLSKHLLSPRVQNWQDHVLDYHYSKDLWLAR